MNRKGFSLVEVMVGIFIFSIIIVGVLSASRFTSRLSAKSIYDSTAHAMALGYARQIKALRYEDFEDLVWRRKANLPFVSILLNKQGGNQSLKLTNDLVNMNISGLRTVAVGWEGNKALREMELGLLLSIYALTGNRVDFGLDYTWNVNGITGQGTIPMSKWKNIEYH